MHVVGRVGGVGGGQKTGGVVGQRVFSRKLDQTETKGSTS